jgi:hypothetical protein
VKDRRVKVETNASTVKDYQLAITAFPRLRTEQITFASSDETKATVSQTGKVTHVSNGSVNITISCPSRTLVVALTMATQTGQNGPAQFLGFVDGSLGANAVSQIDTRLAGKTAAQALPIFSIQDHAAGVYVRNTGGWAADINLTCCSPWNSYEGAKRAGTAITPRHILLAAHYEPAEGTVFRFITADNQVITRTMVKKRRHPAFVPNFPDLTVGVLDSALPASITPCKVLPASWATYLPGIPDSGMGPAATRVPVIVLDQEEKALVADWTQSNTQTIIKQPPVDATRLAFYETTIIGDSGNPVFIVINGVVYLLTVLTTPDSGTFLVPQIAAVNSLIAAADAAAGISTGYTLTQFDPSGFTAY